MNSGVSQFPNHATETESESDPNDSWLERSERRSMRQDPDFEVLEEKFEDINIVLKTVPNPLQDRTFLYFEIFEILRNRTHWKTEILCVHSIYIFLNGFLSCINIR